MTPLPLANRRVLVTRGASQAPKLSDGLRALGALPVEVPVLEIRPPEIVCASGYRAAQSGRNYDWLIFTSTNTLREVSLRCQRFGVNPASAEHLNVAAVGQATAEAARHSGFRVNVVPEA